MDRPLISTATERNASVGGILRLIREGRATTRSDLVTMTGLARSTVAARIDALIENRLVYEAGEAASTGGRPPTVLAFNQHAGVVLVADLGATHCRLGVTDLAGVSLAALATDLDIALGPDKVLTVVQQHFVELLGQIGRGADEVRGIGIGVPGPVEFATGTPISPPIMPGWDGVSIPDRFRDSYDAPVLVDNDVNIMALGEQRTQWPGCDQLLFIKVATGIGCGIVARGGVYHGAQGAAGDIGHIRVSGHSDVICACGNQACVEAVASGSAMARQLSEMGFPARNSRDVVDLVRAGNPAAGRLVRTSGRLIGEVLASIVNFFNPSTIVVGGDVAVAHEQLLAGIREVVYRRSLPLATRHLRLVHSDLGDTAGVTGAAVMVIEHILSDDAVRSLVAEA